MKLLFYVYTYNVTFTIWKIIVLIDWNSYTTTTTIICAWRLKCTLWRSCNWRNCLQRRSRKHHLGRRRKRLKSLLCWWCHQSRNELEAPPRQTQFLAESGNEWMSQTTVHQPQKTRIFWQVIKLSYYERPKFVFKFWNGLPYCRRTFHRSALYHRSLKRLRQNRSRNRVHPQSRT